MKFPFSLPCMFLLALTAVPAVAQYSLTWGDPVDQTCNWTIDKTVTPTSASIFFGDSAQVQWGVDVTFDGTTFSLDGTLDVNSGSTNANNKHLYICVTKNSIDQGACLNPTWVNLGSGNSYHHEYSYAFAGPYTKGADTWAVRAEIRASNNTTVEQNSSHPLAPYFEACSATVADSSSASLGTATESGFSTTYTETFACPADSGLNRNIATVEAEADTADFELDCYNLGVEKTVEDTLVRTWSWKIGKGADQDDILLNTGTQSLDVNYDVDVDTVGHTDSAWHIEGDITVHNPHPSASAEIVTVRDTLDSSGEVAVACDDGGPVVFPYTLVAGGTLNCTYSFDPSDGSDTQNTATAALENYFYPYGGGSTIADTTNVHDPEVVDYEPTHVDECIDVDDTLWDGNENPNVTDMTVCAVGDPPDTLPYHFEYAYTVGPYTDFCDGGTFENTADFETNDNSAVDDTTWTINVSADCERDCVLGFGYWRNHSKYGHAMMRDTTWNAVGGEDAVFFLSGQTYYQVLWTNPVGGNAYYILAHQYIAAELNMLSGASVPSDVQDAFDAATALFNAYTPDYVATLKGKNGKDLRAEFIDAAKVLEQYNTAYCVDHPGENGCPADVSEYPSQCTQESEEALGKIESSIGAVESAESETDDEEPLPAEYALNRNYPNPFNPSTTISFQLPEASQVRLTVYDIRGREVARLVDGNLPAGTHDVQFRADNLPSGLYVYTLSAGGRDFRRTMVLMK